MTDIPARMKSFVAPKKCFPKEYELQDRTVPAITMSTQVLIKIKAATVETWEVQMVAGGMDTLHRPKCVTPPFPNQSPSNNMISLGLVRRDQNCMCSPLANFAIYCRFPLPVGSEGSGVVVAAGSGVQSLKVGDEVYGAYMDKPLFDLDPPGFLSEYAVAEERFLLRKPPQVSFEAAATLASRATTGVQAFRRGMQLGGWESLEGKTVFIPAGLGAVGSTAIEMAKQVYGASKIITTVSTSKIPLVDEHLPGLVDQVIDYQTQNVADVVAPGSVDLYYNTQWTTMDEGIRLLKPGTGVLLSIASMPTKDMARKMFGAHRVPWWLGLTLDLAQCWYAWKRRGTGVAYDMVSGSVEIREDLERAGEIVAMGKVNGVIRVVEMGDVEGVRAACEQVRSGKGGVGKLVVRMPK